MARRIPSSQALVEEDMQQIHKAESQDQTQGEEDMPNIGCNLSAIELTRSGGIRGLFQRAAKYEPYIVGFLTDGEHDIHIKCEPIVGIKKGKPFELSEPITLVDVADVGSHIFGRIEIWESDGGFQKAGEAIKAVQGRIQESSLLSNLADLALGGRRAVISKVFSHIGSALSNQQDDFLDGFDLDFSSEDAPAGSSHQLSGARVSATFSITGTVSGTSAIETPSDTHT